MKNQKYKPSVFNYCSQNESGTILYNTLYNTLVRMSKEEYKQYRGEKKAEPELEELFLENGIWVSKDIDEKKNYLACAEAYTFHMERPLSITVATTLKCNARCTYCYEKGVVQSDLYEGAVDDIYDFIVSKSVQKTVYINWFGGEPLLNIPVMDQLSEKLAENGYEYYSYIITNGSKISNEIIEEKLEQWHVYSMQISLDGTKEIYEERKNYYNKKEGDFYRIIDNIKKLADKVHVSIRLNIDYQNRRDILSLLQELEVIFGDKQNVVFYPAFITGSEHPLTDEEKLDFVRTMLSKIHDVNKVTASTKFYSFPRMHACMNGDPNSFSIDVSGNICTCEHHLGHPELSIGSLDGKKEFMDYRKKSKKLREECEKCVFLPKCFGGCESNLLDGDTPCMIEKYLIQAYLELL